jgi:hypothetical protein
MRQPGAALAAAAIPIGTTHLDQHDPHSGSVVRAFQSALSSPGILGCPDESKLDLPSLERRHSITVDQRDLSPLVVMKSPDSTIKFFMQTVYEERVPL